MDRILIRAILPVLFFATLSLLPIPALAQTGASDLLFGADLTIELSPPHPSPGETVRARAHSTLIDLTGVMLTWSANGTTIARGVGVSEASVTAGAPGSETALTVVVSEDGSDIISATARIRPVEIDLLWESDSYTPPFFKGRAFPSAGTSLHLEAIPRFVRAGSLVPVGDIIFTWRRNGYVIENVSGRGRSRALIESPVLFGNDTISVDARTADGIFEGGASARISSVEPRVVLYENHPVFGIAYHHALGSESQIPEVETSFSAVPYFAEARNLDGGALSYEWRVNGIPIANDPARPSTVTISASGSSNTALIELAITHVTNFFMNSFGSWNLQFLGANAAFGQTQ
ncbi:hypothetical protein A2853_03435 [Candidatus Kaiserbacteria bacterium RIFCSPHIGHO2_01_FULL_55_17]|uniref:Uncharacterized protein n=1 Tax=Candidatus Kaiserbacteria bacterium RIFCSPHIGHO2_01_FULL_55_17 TaxID=1798484 RepID=A0A1F6D9C6_9BACT|nr:MAG: hypothetical protein A2853_03435 [Candidatus Kaiserbacteria bacterium RIFCSPHIGHO2_01_FULL_55_17]